MDGPEDIGFAADIERNLLGSLLTGQGFTRVRAGLRPEHFVEPIHRRIYEAISLAYERTSVTSMPTVMRLLPEDLRRDIELRTSQTAGAYLAGALAGTPYTAASVEAGARAVVEQWARIAGMERLEEAAHAMRDPAAEFASVARLVGGGLEEIGSDLRAMNGQRTRATIGEASADVLFKVEAAMSGTGVTGVPWGPLSDVDRVTGGMQRQDLILVGARPSMGKTSLATSVALGAARKGHGVGFLSLEMARGPISLRALSELTLPTDMHIAYSDALHGRLKATELSHLRSRQAILAGYPIEIDDGPATTFDVRAKIEGMSERFHRAGRPRLELLIIDHLGFVQASSAYRGNRNNEIGEITRALKGYAKEFDLALLLLSQLSRDVTKRDDKRPQLSDLRDSGNIEQDADLVAFLHREAYYLEREKAAGDRAIEQAERLDACRNKLEFIIAKQRMGPTVTVDLWCDMALSAVRNGDRYRS